jgi:hypothetical protein
MIEKVMIGAGVVMTIGLVFIFRSTIRQIRAEAAAEKAAIESKSS